VRGYLFRQIEAIEPNVATLNFATSSSGQPLGHRVGGSST
jgi:hypothetical protein